MSERYICTKGSPWDETKGKFATHPDAVEIELNLSSSSFWEYEQYKCPNCDTTWKVYYDDIR